MSVLERDRLGADPWSEKSRLVVIGNGMAGARTIEEILSRGGADLFSITMFGDEPYGNYNRIMLSHVLSGEDSESDIFLNTMDWYVENDITLHAGVRIQRIDRFAKVVYADDGSITPYDKLTLQHAPKAPKDHVLTSELEHELHEHYGVAHPEGGG